MNSNVDMLDLAMRAHKGKLSKSKIRYNFQNWESAREYTNIYTLERIDQTINTVPISKNTPVYLYPMAQKNDEYENLEMKFAKKSHEIDILDYRKAYWAFDKATSNGNWGLRTPIPRLVPVKIKEDSTSAVVEPP